MGGIVGAKAYAKSPSAIMPMPGQIMTNHQHHPVPAPWLRERKDMIDRMNWCLANCEGSFKVAPLTTSTEDEGGWSSHDVIDQLSFIFDLDTDAVLYKMKWEGVK